MKTWRLILLGVCLVLPVFASTSMQQGIAYFRAGNYEKAKHFFSQGKSAEDYYNLGNTHSKMHQYDLALKAYDDAIALKPDFTAAIFNRKLIAELHYQQLFWMLSVQHLIDDPSGYLRVRLNWMTCVECLA